MATYYVEKVGPDRYDMRQTRYRKQRGDRRSRDGGHPHDVMAACFSAQQMRELIAKHFPDADIDTSALPPQE